MKILVSNHNLDSIGGSETFTFTIIEELKRLGHLVEYFTFNKGFVCRKIEDDLNVNFMSHSKYDLILANHNTTVDFLHKRGFVIQTCHGIFPKLEQPSFYADAYVSISEEVQNHLAMFDCPSLVIRNSINLERFKPITAINSKLNNILSLCHSEKANNFIKDICNEQSINYLQAYKYKNPIWKIEDVINNSDLVIGLGRSAYEAMACGRPVLIYDNRKYFDSCGDGYVKDILGFSLRNNCSGRFSKTSFDKSNFIDELNKYSSSDSKYFRNFAKKELDVRINIEKYLSFYNDLVYNRRRKKRLKKIRFAKKIIGKKNFNLLAKAHNTFRKK